MDKPISTQLQEIQTRTGWSQTRLAREIGTSQPTVNRILNGQKDCTGKTLRAIAGLHRQWVRAGVSLQHRERQQYGSSKSGINPAG
jgi:transcriptional regulator with XRE-family HTH domain